MAELTTLETNAGPCCAPEQQATCCEPSAKADCCGHEEGCDCAAGTGAREGDVCEKPPVLREVARVLRPIVRAERPRA
jgi:arsenite methyltransferase